MWSTDGTSVSSEAWEMDVTTVESGEKGVVTVLCMYIYVLYGFGSRLCNLFPDAPLVTHCCAVGQIDATRAAWLSNYWVAS